MRDETADVVFPFLRAGLILRQRLQSTQAVDLDPDTERQKLLSLLQAPPKTEEALADYWPDHAFGGGFSVEPHYHLYLGIRYALTCWIDEIMIQIPIHPSLPWYGYWSNNKLENPLYGDNLRA